MIDFNTVFLGLDKNPIKNDGKVVTLREVTVNALLAPADISGTDKMKRFLLAQKIHEAAEEIKLFPEELVLIKDLIGKAYSPLFVGRAYQILNGGG